MKKRIFIISILLIFTLLVACGKQGDLNIKGNKQTEDNSKSGTASPLSGIYVDEEKINRRPVAVMFDNHPRARWQAGLNEAEIVYEFLVEHPYTRYMGIYLINDPKLIGPVRSARPYFISTLLQYDPLYVRCGGSEQAKSDVIKYNVADIDGLVSKSFWRSTKTGKKSPHNLYTSMKSVREEQKRMGYSDTSDYEGFKFNKEDTSIEGSSANTVKIIYNGENSTKYVYNEDKKVYERYKDGKLHIDESDKSTITAKNIIIQKTTGKTIDSEGRKEIDVVGSGDGMYITDGKAKRITWEKASVKSRTIYYDENGEEISLNPGVTWIQVTASNTNVSME
ncbi:protein of unknown function DUF3048 [Gottschalkia purinilytica]|uniref:Lipoprotein YerB n=1 Tax=Gottschalkia purinilytica TaxID=1503 RepID=A0A0L0WCZ1_GOTPU|nr:DUF3048 domain-containing protein [Gottschalkia purinilytica]KNF09342.1 protein of unknown function DUF3048 [Gottschalkia purinilytica]